MRILEPKPKRTSGLASTHVRRAASAADHEQRATRLLGRARGSQSQGQALPAEQHALAADAAASRAAHAVHDFSRVAVYAEARRDSRSPVQPGLNISGGASTGLIQRSTGTTDYPVLNKQIIVTNADGPHFHSCSHQPQFEWRVNFSPPTGQTGWIVQRVESTYDVHNCDGTVGKCDGTPNVPADPNFPPTPLYWEAWRIAGVGLDPDPSGGHDTWRRTFEVPTCGSWSIDGTLYYADALPADFVANNPAVPSAGIVPATTTDPTRKVLGNAIGRRRIAGEWSCCDPNASNHYHRRTK
ncbi:MAG TPA: hypothetical protein VFZ66_01195 [Herpetosiphonaceae bacterium]